MAILSHIAGRRNAAEQAADELHEKLLAEQRRSEELSAELHRLRMEELS
jgi:septum formation topological specificity factor MinE